MSPERARDAKELSLCIFMYPNDFRSLFPPPLPTDYPIRIVILSERSTVGVYPDLVGVPRMTLRGDAKDLSSNLKYLRDLEILYKQSL
jgi:hypothetical protein